MNIKELLIENHTGSLQDDVSNSLPSAFTIPELKNTDPYMQYRYGIAVAAARRLDNKESDEDQEEFDQTSKWGENLIVVSYSPEDVRTLELAAKLMNVKPQEITKDKSSESPTVYSKSPIKPIK